MRKKRGHKFKGEWGYVYGRVQRVETEGREKKQLKYSFKNKQKIKIENDRGKHPTYCQSLTSTYIYIGKCTSTHMCTEI